MASDAMVRSNGARLAYWFARRSFGSKLVDDSSITLNKALHQRNPREFGSDICNSSRFLGKSENGNQRNGAWFGVSHCGLDSKRLFHWTQFNVTDQQEVRELRREVRELRIEVRELRREVQGLKKLHPDTTKDEANVESDSQEVKAHEEESFSELNRGAVERFNDLLKLGIKQQKMGDILQVRELVKQNLELKNARRAHLREEMKIYGFGICVMLYISVMFVRGVGSEDVVV